MDDDIASLLLAQQRHLVDAVMENEKIAREFEISLAELQLLHLLVLRPEVVTAQQVVTTTGLSSSTVSNMLDRLERRRFIARHRDSRDKRRWVVTPTDRCEEIARRYESSEMARRLTVAVAGLTTEQIRTVVRYFQRLNDA